MESAGLSVLILEPNALQCDLIKMSLARHGMRPILCDGPDDLRRQLSESLPDVLLIDTHLPGWNGLDLVAELTTEVLLRRTRIFFISSMGYPEVVQRAAKMGASGFLVKPLNMDLLIGRIREACQPAGRRSRA